MVMCLLLIKTFLLNGHEMNEETFLLWPFFSILITWHWNHFHIVDSFLILYALLSFSIVLRLLCIQDIRPERTNDIILLLCLLDISISYAYKKRKKIDSKDENKISVIFFSIWKEIVRGKGRKWATTSNHLQL